MNMRNIKPYILPIVSGYLFYIVQMLIWGYLLALENPLFHDLFMSVFLPDNQIMFSVVTYFRDALINLLIAIPFALAFLKLNSRQRLIALAIAVIPCFLYEYRYLFINYEEISHIFWNSAGAYYGFAISLLMLPFSVWLITKIRSTGVINEV
jgi:hypothetical protein